MARASQQHLASQQDKRLALAQHFFKQRSVVRRLVRSSSIQRQDTVLEIGPGTGIITCELAAVAGCVVAIEKDPALVAQLRKRFQRVEHVQVRQGDFLRVGLPRQAYKIFANIPFNCTAGIVRKILGASNPPHEAYLVMQKEAAQKFVGVPHETQFSVLAKPWFEMRIVRQLRRSDFDPRPGVDVVLLHIQKRDPPLVAPPDGTSYRRFVRSGFRGHKQNLRLTYKQTFTYRQWKRLARDLDLPRNAVPTQVTFDQWLGLFRFFCALSGR